LREEELYAKIASAAKYNTIVEAMAKDLVDDISMNAVILWL
jgi:hypothetical protein